MIDKLFLVLKHCKILTIQSHIYKFDSFNNKKIDNLALDFYRKKITDLEQDIIERKREYDNMPERQIKDKENKRYNSYKKTVAFEQNASYKKTVPKEVRDCMSEQERLKELQKKEQMERSRIKKEIEQNKQREKYADKSKK